MAAGGWKTPAMFRRYAIVSSADHRAAIEKLEQARAANSPKTALISEGDASRGLADKNTKVQ
jgi:hypothetical protein